MKPAGALGSFASKQWTEEREINMQNVNTVPSQSMAHLEEKTDRGQVMF